MRRHRWHTMVACLLTLGGVVLVVGLPTRDAAAGAFAPATVREVNFNTTLGHNIANLTVQRHTSTHEVNFLAAYLQTGGVTRWGLPTSEIMEEEDGHLTQYYQRGILDWHLSPQTCGTLDGFCIERRLAWDYFGGGLDGAPDLGVEAGVVSSAPGIQSGPWGHRVSNVSLEGVQVDFLQFYERLEGLGAFGYPKTEARRDTNRPGTVHIPAATPGFIRQYFQAAVMEFHPGDPEPVKLRLLGDDLRDQNYPDEAWKAFRSFRTSTELRPGNAYEIERVYKGRRTVQGRLLELYPPVEHCSAVTWRLGQQFCAAAGAFRQQSSAFDLLTGDAVRTTGTGAQAWPDTLLRLLTGPGSNSPDAAVDTDIPGLLAMLQAGLVQGVAWLRDGTVAIIHVVTPGEVAMTISVGEAALLTEAGADLYYETPDGLIQPIGTLLLIKVERPGASSTRTTVKVVEGSARVRPVGGASFVTVRAGEEARLVNRGAPTVQPMAPLDPVETKLVALARQSASLLGKPPGAGTVQPGGGGARPTVTVTTDRSSANTGDTITVRVSGTAAAGLQSVSWRATRPGNSNGNDNAADDLAQDHTFQCGGQARCDQSSQVLLTVPGTYTVTALARDTAGQQSEQGRAELVVSRPQTPVLQVSPLELNVQAAAPGRVVIRNLGGSPLSWKAESDASWLSMVPASSGLGANGGWTEVQVQVDPQKLPDRNRQTTGQIRVASDGGQAVVRVTYQPR